MRKNCIPIFGEVLFDHFPDGTAVLGGAPFNVACHLQAFGYPPCLISRIGQDQEGNAIILAMQKRGMDLSGIQQDKKHPTGTVRITLDEGEPSYNILDKQAYDFIEAEEEASTLNNGLLYHGSLALRNKVSRQAFKNLKTRHQGKVFFDVNLRQPWWNKEDVLQWLDQADWVKLNLEEFQRLQSNPKKINIAMKSFLQEHAIECLIVTCGKQGAIAINSTGELVEVAPVYSAPVIDTVGAGDAFASILLLGIYRDWPLTLSMERSQAFASAMVGQPGATVQDMDFYQPFINSWNT
jgi:fructokinase